MVKERLRLFLEIVRAAYLGENFNCGGRTFNLKPTLVSPYDFVRKISVPKSKFEELLASLDEGFKNEARTELYRAERGWIDQGAKGHEGLRIRATKAADEKGIIIPVLSPPAVGVDTSGVENSSTVFAFCFFTDPEAAYVFLEKHLNLLKVKEPPEYKWSKLNPLFKDVFAEKFGSFLNLFCDGVLVLHTDAFIKPEAKHANIFVNLIVGCFTGYEHLGRPRRELRDKFFKLANGVPMHCDADFAPLRASNIVRMFVQTLAKTDGGIARPFTPLYSPLKSHESKTIQIADLVAGHVAHRIKQRGGPPEFFAPLFIDKRKLRKVGKKKFVKAYCWIKK